MADQLSPKTDARELQARARRQHQHGRLCVPRLVDFSFLLGFRNIEEIAKRFKGHARACARKAD
jgi:hypothetical protein